MIIYVPQITFISGIDNNQNQQKANNGHNEEIEIPSNNVDGGDIQLQHDGQIKLQEVETALNEKLVESTNHNTCDVDIDGDCDDIQPQHDHQIELQEVEPILNEKAVKSRNHDTCNNEQIELPSNDVDYDISIATWWSNQTVRSWTYAEWKISWIYRSRYFSEHERLKAIVIVVKKAQRENQA